MPEVVVPIGPHHPALKEPVNFRVIADGEKIVRLELDLSYNHRGIEKAAEQRNFIRVLPLLERVCGICSHSHATAFAKGVEEIMGLEIPPRARYIRTIIAELERMHSHLLWLGVAAHEIGFNTLFMWSWRDREAVQDTLEEMSGNRVHYGMNEIGGVRRDLTPAQIKTALARLPDLEDRIQKYVGMVNSEETMLIRFRGVGKMSREEALKYGAVGPTARASGVDYDVRRDDPYLAYDEIPWKVITDNHGDVYGRTRVRVGELWESTQIVRFCLENIPAGPVRVEAPKNAPEGEILSRYEAPRGELAHYIRTNGTDKVERIDIRSPTLANWTSVAMCLTGQNLADIPVIVAAIDPCLSCTCRMVVVHRRGGRAVPGTAAGESGHDPKSRQDGWRP
ncbi:MULTISPECIES: nickel-dependent hydrogenase large subunit [unclassified Methanoregula]|uniref:hydrogenase large subunit n=1 Tax=unclassified Methanoregula TaxID=2649730 RepID=UPI0009D00ED7|nr:MULTISPECIES: nickel-dependent hydrogenase large subunit [unclassified Methanoregula]OPX64261.1 MAG: Membrane-bound hydrogenase subunit alpha [Methanoregula sp. PtaB.Bin085]OPY33614.1 MAG: Membrane-bound hydrogenase subunit alpha [Methanoregula sp. PtaU1.Bin006]